MSSPTSRLSMTSMCQASTSFNQPLDRCVMRSFKSKLAKQVAGHYAETVIAKFRAKEDITVDTTSLRRPATSFLCGLQMRPRNSLQKSMCVRVLDVSEGERHAILVAANLQHEGGTLFHHKFRGLRHKSHSGHNSVTVAALNASILIAAT
eukprot:2883811-Amphidinium_carterae.1